MSEAEPRTAYVKGNLYNVKLDDLKTDPTQPRKYIDPEAQKELNESIKTYGVLQSILLRQDHDGNLFVVAGERRLRAAREVGLEKIPAIFIDGNPDEIAIVENLLRQDLTAVELAETLDRVKTKYRYSQVQLASMIGKSETTVSEILSLIKLPEEIRDECRDNPRISRQTLLDISKKKTAEKMLKAYNKYKEKLSKSEVGEKKKRKKTWHDKLSSKCNDLKTIIKGQDLGSLAEPVKNDLITSIEELITELNAWCEKIKPVRIEVIDLEEKPGRKLKNLEDIPPIEEVR